MYVHTLFLRIWLPVNFLGACAPLHSPQPLGGDIMTFMVFSQATLFAHADWWRAGQNGMVVAFGTELISIVLAPLYALALHRYLVPHFVIFLFRIYTYIYIYFFGVGSFGGERETNSNEYKLVKCRVLDDASLPVKMWYDRWSGGGRAGK